MHVSIALLLATASAPTTQSSTAAVDLSVPQRARPPLLQPDEKPEAPPDQLEPGSWLPKLGDGLGVEVGFRFGLGTDATDIVRDDPPYAALIGFRGRAERDRWYGVVSWGVQIAGPEANPPGNRSRQTFLPWEIGIDAGFEYSPAPGWRLRPQVGARAQPEAISASTNSDIGVVADLLAERTWATSENVRFLGSVRAVGRYGPGDHDLSSEQRYRRTTCYLWGRELLDCALAFTVAPGTVGAEAQFAGSWQRFTASVWGGWFVAAKADEVNPPSMQDRTVPQDDGDWTWLGIRLAFAAADDIDVAASALTGGRLRDSLGSNRVPLFASDLARTTVVVHVAARL